MGVAVAPRPRTTSPMRRLVLVGGEGEDTGDEAGAGDAGERRLRSVPTDTKLGHGRRRKVLLADDEPSMRLLCKVNLDLAGFDVVEAESGTEALEKARADRYDLVLLDVMMPDLSGHEVAQQLRSDASTRRLPIVFLSARASEDDLRLGYELGAVDYITKPFDPIGLAGRVEQVLERIEAGEADAYRRAQLDKLGRG